MFFQALLLLPIIGNNHMSLKDEPAHSGSSATLSLKNDPLKARPTLVRKRAIRVRFKPL